MDFNSYLYVRVDPIWSRVRAWENNHFDVSHLNNYTNTWLYSMWYMYIHVFIYTFCKCFSGNSSFISFKRGQCLAGNIQVKSSFEVLEAVWCLQCVNGRRNWFSSMISGFQAPFSLCLYTSSCIHESLWRI